MTNFIIGTLLLMMMAIEKLSFVIIEYPIYFSVPTLISAVVLIFAIVYGLKLYLKDSSISIKKISLSRAGWFFLFLTIIIIGMSFILNFNRWTVGWDAVALYDARAKFLYSGLTFSKMSDLSNYDPQNSYYYLLYPPFTSLVHYHWMLLSIKLPVGVYYSINLLLLSLIVFNGFNKKIGNNLSLVLAFLSISSISIFSSSILEYTNLPFTIYILLGIIFIGDYLENRTVWKLIYGISLIVCSQWIRFQEPIWLGVAIAMIVMAITYKKFRHTLIPGVVVLLFGFFERYSWSSFISASSSTNTIVNFNLINIIEPILGIFTGSLFSIGLFFVDSWAPLIFVYIISVAVIINRRTANAHNVFYLLINSLIIMIYFGGLYFVSFQSIWWDKLGDSLVRSSAFLIPINAMILLSELSKTKFINVKKR